MIRIGMGILLLGAVHCADASLLGEDVVSAGRYRTTQFVIYDGAYRSIAYPMGDVAANRGVCTDVIVRSYRALGVDLQQKVHEDMKSHFSLYPKLWGLTRPDTNIDHRRVPNLQVFFTRFGHSFPVSELKWAQLQPGDLVTWMLPGNRPHIGIVSDRKSADGKRPLIIHNIGLGPKEEDTLEIAPVTGHYRYLPDNP